MKTIGLIGGMSWESSAEYYRIINREMQHRLGGVSSAKLVLYSVNFAEIEAMQRAALWDDASAVLAGAGRRLAGAGADFFLICANTMHLMAEAIEAAAGIPILHIVDPTAEKIRQAGLSRVGLLGTAYTMEKDFYKGRLAGKYGLDVIIPDPRDRAEVHRIIFEELVRGELKQSSRSAYRDIITRLVAHGAQGIILGCTEIPLLVKPEDSAVPLFDTTELHALAAVDMALA
jgi:aspartate racemase